MKATFKAYQPQLKQMSFSQGGGFSLTLEIPESEYENVKELLDPALKEQELTVRLKAKRIF